MVSRHIMVRAKSISQAKKFGKMHAKMSTFEYSGERVTSAKLDKSAGLAGGIPGYTVRLTRRKVERYTTGKKKGMLRPKYNR